MGFIGNVLWFVFGGFVMGLLGNVIWFVFAGVWLWGDGARRNQAIKALWAPAL